MDTDSFSYRIEKSVDPTEVEGVFRRSGIQRPIDDPDRIARMIQHANVIVSARHRERLVGIIRALTDFSYCCYLSDLAVDKEYQRRGVGKALIRTLQDFLGTEVMICLLSAPEAMSYYPGTGFEKADHAWWIPREH